MKIFGYRQPVFSIPPTPDPMKKILTLFAVLVALVAQAQSFEGIVRWTMSMEITDPQMRAQMAQAQQQLNDPETQAQLKEMEEKMNDPEMKKMMEQNPQMKAAMEQAMKSAKGGGAPDMNNMMPKGMTIKVKGAGMITLIEGGMADGMEMLYADGQPPVRIDRQKKTYSKMPEQASSEAPQVNVTRAPETMKILGYTCQKYLVEVVSGGQTMKQVMWTTTEIKDMDMKALSRQRSSQGQPMFSDKVQGVPLKIEMSAPQGNMVMEVKEIKRETLNSADFKIPAGFKETKFAPY
jgi:TolA-binding protein